MIDSKEKTNAETTEVSSKKLLVVTIIVVVALVAGFYGLNKLFIASTDKMIKGIDLKPQAAELRALRAREKETLNSYKILDENKGVVQIPIERAMKLLADEAFAKQEKR